MTAFEAGDIVRVPFPHVERPVVVPRPAVVVTPQPVGPGGLLTWTAMVTSAQRKEWPGDIPIADWEGLGLIIASKVRTAKLFTAETAALSLIGRLDPATTARIRDALRGHLGL